MITEINTKINAGQDQEQENDQDIAKTGTDEAVAEEKKDDDDRNTTTIEETDNTASKNVLIKWNLEMLTKGDDFFYGGYYQAPLHPIQLFTHTPLTKLEFLSGTIGHKYTYGGEEYIPLIGMIFWLMDPSMDGELVDETVHEVLRLLKLQPVPVYITVTRSWIINLKHAMDVVQIYLLQQFGENPQFVSQVKTMIWNYQKSLQLLDNIDKNDEKRLIPAEEMYKRSIVEMEAFIYMHTGRTDSELFGVTDPDLLSNAKKSQIVRKQIKRRLYEEYCQVERFCEIACERGVDYRDVQPYTLTTIERQNQKDEEERQKELIETAERRQQELINEESKAQLKAEKKKQKNKSKRERHKLSVRSRVDILLDTFTQTWQFLRHNGLTAQEQFVKSMKEAGMKVKLRPKNIK